MANLGLLGAVAGLGQGLQTFGADLVKRRDQALEWARQEAEDQRKELEHKQELQDQYTHEQNLTVYREEHANARNAADNTAAAQRATDTANVAHANRMEEIKAEQIGQRDIHAADAQAAQDLARLKSDLDQSNSEKDAKLKHDLDSQDVAGIKYGERYSVNPKSKRPYSDPNSQYTELLIVKKDGSIVHTGKLILAPQNHSGQDNPDNPYG